MKLYALVILVAIAVAECRHTFIGTNVFRPQVYHENKHYLGLYARRRVEVMTFSLPQNRYEPGRAIRGILAYDLTYSDASLNVTYGGIGYQYATLRMMSAVGQPIRYDVYIYA